jgi:valyl-tRNA synthetase
VAVNPEDERYRQLVGQNCILPIVGRVMPIIADDYIDPEFGTGALKVTPGHDINDFEIGRRHGLDEPCVIGPDGRMSDEAGEGFSGMTIAEAQHAVMAELRELGLIRSETPYPHSVPFSHRSGQRIEPLISLQWFCRMDELAKPAIDVVRDGRVQITPEQWSRVYLDWMENIRPWCVSRQLWWGHRLPVWYCDACEEVYVAESAPERCGACGGELRQDEDVLDTWFSSALWPFATLGWPDEPAPALDTFYPTSVLTTARDIIYLWVARMIMTGLEFTGEVPFRDVYVHSVIQARDGRRMSKSLGTGIDPLEEIEVHGADALRFGLLAMSSTQDVRYSDAKVQQGRDLTNKIWNASRLILLGAADATPAPAGQEPEDLWIRARLSRAITAVTERIDAFDFANAAAELYRFFWSELCDWYLEIAKPRLYGDEPEVAQNLLWLLENVLALAHPMVPFVTEEVWSYLPDRRAPLVVSRFPEAGGFGPDDERGAEAGIEAVRAVRNWRELAGVPVGATLPARIGDGLPGFVATLAKLDPGAEGGDVVATLGQVEILASEQVDNEQARRRIDERLRELESEVKRAEGKLANEGFVSGAPPDVVEAERRKLDAYRSEYDELAGLVR